MRIYLETGFFVDYLSTRGHSGQYLRTEPRRGRSVEQIAADAEECATRIARDHELFTSSLTFYEVDEAMYRQLADSARGVPHSRRLVIPAARAVMVQMMMAVELLRVQIVGLDKAVVTEQLRQIDLQLHGVRAADSLHITSAIMVNARAIISADGDILTLDGRFSASNGEPISCWDTDAALQKLYNDTVPDEPGGA